MGKRVRAGEMILGGRKYKLNGGKRVVDVQKCYSMAKSKRITGIPPKSHSPPSRLRPNSIPPWRSSARSLHLRQAISSVLGCVRSPRVVIRPREGDERVERHKRSTELGRRLGRHGGPIHCILLTLSVYESLSRTSIEFSSCNKALSTFELNPAFDSIGMPICWASRVSARAAANPSQGPTNHEPGMALCLFLLCDAGSPNVCPTLSWVVRCCLTLPCLSSSAY
ncbi:uncharacterized protein CCOS01_12917 [Colletotrichum costaricense]|uniref:Uncharacterized protein n=1 Tax=Colletotrichum costaricense TaxID=1209916 RepID=A0AAI9YLU6_9PEZI|nr:uncharacterized protein CCOS01_12917 [Colletotrichum costaricense]KAK1515719.1 hypothetical protein CCOS01_12917 [Colletotrichum costaricense]